MVNRQRVDGLIRSQCRSGGGGVGDTNVCVGGDSIDVSRDIRISPELANAVHTVGDKVVIGVATIPPLRTGDDAAGQCGSGGKGDFGTGS